MKKQIKDLFVFALVALLLAFPFCSISVFAEAAQRDVTSYYNNTISTATHMNISSSGKMTISYKYSGYASITNKAVITTYIEKKTLGLFWSRIDIGTSNDEWIDTISNYKYTGSRKYQLPSSGTYRVTVIYKIYGSGGAADKIEYQEKGSY